MQATPHHPYQFLSQKIRILYADPNPESHIRFLLRFKRFGLVKIEFAYSAGEVIRELSNKRYHICFLGPGIDAAEKEKFFILKRFGPIVPIIIYAENAILDQVVDNIKAGAFSLVERINLNEVSFFSTIHSAILKSVFYPRSASVMHSYFNRAFIILIKKKPASVGDWSAEMNVDERQMRRICNCWKFPLRDILISYKMLDEAIAFYRRRINRKGCKNEDIRHAVELSRKFEAVYGSHKKIIDAIFESSSVGNIPVNGNDDMDLDTIPEKWILPVFSTLS